MKGEERNPKLARQDRKREPPHVCAAGRVRDTRKNGKKNLK